MARFHFLPPPTLRPRPRPLSNASEALAGRRLRTIFVEATPPSGLWLGREIEDRSPGEHAVAPPQPTIGDRSPIPAHQNFVVGAHFEALDASATPCGGQQISATEQETQGGSLIDRHHVRQEKTFAHDRAGTLGPCLSTSSSRASCLSSSEGDLVPGPSRLGSNLAAGHRRSPCQTGKSNNTEVFEHD